MAIDSRSALVQTVRENFERLSATQKEVATFLLEHPEEGSRLSARDLAKRTNSSASTVVRLARVLGFESFQAMQASLFAEARPSRSPLRAAQGVRWLPAVSSRMSARFVGRDAERDTLLEIFGDGSRVAGRMVLLEGEAGIGKTRLSIEFARECQQRGAIVLYGGCDHQRVIPYQPFSEALRDALAPGATNLRGQVPKKQLSQLAGVLPQLTGAMSNAQATHPPDVPVRHQLFNAVATTLIGLSSVKPLVLVLDDLHWADKATLLMLRHVVRATRAAPMLVLGAYRDTERGQDLLETLAELHREHIVDHIALTGLDEGDANELIDDVSRHAIPLDLRHTLWEQCRGNPFFLEEMALHHTMIPNEALPDAIRSVINQRLVRLSTNARTTLAVASVAGNQFSIHVLERVVELSEDACADALRETIEARLIDEQPGSYGRLAFHNALIHQTVYGRLTHTRRARLHQRVGEVLEELDADNPSRLAELAHHFSLAPPDLRAKADKYAILAARRVLDTLPHQDAAHRYGALFAMLGPRTDPNQRDKLWYALRDTQNGASETAAARAFLDAIDEGQAIPGSAS